MRLHFSHCAILSIFVFGVAANARAQTPIGLRSVSYAGSACPASTVDAALSNDGKELTILFGERLADTGISPMVRVKNCQISLNLVASTGWTFALAGQTFDGFLHLDHGVTGLVSSSTYFQGIPQTARFTETLVGPLSGQHRGPEDALSAASLAWSPCNDSRSTNLNTQFRVNNARNPRGHGAIGDPDQIDGSVKLIYRLLWKRCS